MVHPGFAWLFKNASVWNVYSAAKAYGFHRVYRRLLEANRRLPASAKDRKIVQQNIKLAMRFPNKVVEVMEESHTIAFLQKYAVEIATDMETKTPPFFASASSAMEGKAPPFFASAVVGPLLQQLGTEIVRIILDKTPVGKMMSFFDEVRRRKRPKPPPSPPSSSSSSSSSPSVIVLPPPTTPLLPPPPKKPPTTER